MTFVLKDLSVLRKHFDDTVAIILKRDGKEYIEELSNPRKYELQFLSSVLDKLEEQTRQKKAPTTYQSTVFYGAMLTIIQDIENNRKSYENSGLLNSRLADLIGINAEAKPEDKPDLYQTTKFYATLNAFLNQVFVDNDSRKGFAQDHALNTLHTKNLSELIKTSYKLEQNAHHKAITASLVSDKKTTVYVTEFKEVKKSPASATDRFDSWDTLNAEIDDLIKDELADKNLSKIEKLSPVRAAQLHFLNAIRDSLKNALIDEAEKISILAGAMQLVRKQIFDEYANAYVGNLENSVIYKGLNKILGKIDEVSAQDVEALISSTIHFIRFMTIELKFENKKAIRSKHIFVEIAGFDLKATLNLLIDMVFICRLDALKAVVDKYNKEHKESEKPAAGYLGNISASLGKLSLFRTKKENESDDDDYDNDLEHTSTSTAAR